MSESSSLSDLSRFVGTPETSSETAMRARRQAANALIAHLDQPLRRRGVGDLLAVVLALSARTRRMILPQVAIELDVFGPEGTRAVTMDLPPRG